MVLGEDRLEFACLDWKLCEGGRSLCRHVPRCGRPCGGTGSRHTEAGTSLVVASLPGEFPRTPGPLVGAPALDFLDPNVWRSHSHFSDFFCSTKETITDAWESTHRLLRAKPSAKGDGGGRW